MGAYRIRQSVILAATIFYAAAITVGCVANKPATPSEVDEVEIITTDPLKAFEGEYKAIGKKVEKGSLPSEVMSRATEIRIGLRKYLIKTEAQLEILRLDVLHGADGQREIALNQVVELVAEREQTKISYLHQLQALKAGSRTSEEKTGKKGKYLDIVIEISPEDIADGERP